MGSLSIRLPCCQCDKCATCRRWKTLQTSHSLPVLGFVSVFYFLTLLPFSPGAFTSLLQLPLSIGVKLKEMALSSSACQIFLKSLFKRSPYVRVSISVCFVFEVCGVLSVSRCWFFHCTHICTRAHVRRMRVKPKCVTADEEAHLCHLSSVRHFFFLFMSFLLICSDPTLFLNSGLISTHNDTPSQTDCTSCCLLIRN